MRKENNILRNMQIAMVGHEAEKDAYMQNIVSSLNNIEILKYLGNSNIFGLIKELHTIKKAKVIHLNLYVL